MITNRELLKIAESYLGTTGKEPRQYCGLPNGASWCDAFVTYVYYKGGVKKLYCNGSKETYCPHSIEWCRAYLAEIPLYLAMPSDIIFFDWEPNGAPNHIGLVRERVNTAEIKTIEGNTNGGVVAYRTRKKTVVCGVFRPHFVPENIDTSKPVTIDGQFGYKSVAMVQRALGINQDGILGKNTVKSLQRRAGATPDGVWRAGTSKAIQRMIGAGQDGEFGANSVRALQAWANKQVFETPTENGRKVIETLRAASELELMTTRIVQSLAIAEGFRYVFYSTRDGNGQTVKSYSDRDKTGEVVNYTSLGHANGATYAEGYFYVCSYYGKKNTRQVKVINAVTMRIVKTLTLPVAVSGIAYYNGTFYGSKGSTVYVFKDGWKVARKIKIKASGTPQDIAAYKGYIYACRSYVKGSVSYIDKYTVNGDYVGSYKVTANELESCAIDENGKIHYITYNKSRLIRTEARA